MQNMQPATVSGAGVSRSYEVSPLVALIHMMAPTGGQPLTGKHWPMYLNVLRQGPQMLEELMPVLRFIQSVLQRVSRVVMPDGQRTGARDAAQSSAVQSLVSTAMPSDGGTIAATAAIRSEEPAQGTASESASADTEDAADGGMDGGLGHPAASLDVLRAAMEAVSGTRGHPHI